MGLPLGNDGKPVPSQAGSFCGLIPKGAKNVAVAKDFLKITISFQVSFFRAVSLSLRADYRVLNALWRFAYLTRSACLCRHQLRAGIQVPKPSAPSPACLFSRDSAPCVAELAYMQQIHRATQFLIAFFSAESLPAAFFLPTRQTIPRRARACILTRSPSNTTSLTQQFNSYSSFAHHLCTALSTAPYIFIQVPLFLLLASLRVFILSTPHISHHHP